MAQNSSSSGFPELGSSSSWSSWSYGSSWSNCTSGISSAGSPVPGGGGSGKAPRINQAVLRSLLKSETILLVAQLSDYAPPLNLRRIYPKDVTAQLAEILAVRALAGGAGKVSKLASTQLEWATCQAFLLFYDEFQTAAKQEYSRSDRLHLRLYHYGENHLVSRAILEQFGEDVIDNAAVDDLPGITPAKITAARAALKAYTDSNVAQGTSIKDASKGTLTLAQRLKLITDYRVKVQLAADAEWPHTNPANAPIRRLFQIPAKRKFRG